MTSPSIARQQPADVDAARETLQRVADDMDTIQQRLDNGLLADGPIVQLVGSLAAAITALAAVVWECLPAQLPVKVAACPLCRQAVIPNPDGTLPAHEINPGPRRSPICHFRGVVKDGAL